MDVSERLARFIPVELTADRSDLDERQQALVRHLIAAGRQIHEIYLRQVWPGNPDLRARLAASTDPQDRERLRLFELMAGPWDRLDEDRPFIGEQPRPPGGGFYPEDLGREEFEAYLADHPQERPALTALFTLVRRREGGLEAVPYHRAYREFLEPAAESLLEAARLCDHPPLAEYLSLRAQALLNDDYYESDCAWVVLQDGPFEFLIGPYEVYDDRLFGYKAAYEAMLGRRNREESERFRDLAEQLPLLAEQLPVPAEYRGQAAGLASPIVIADAVFNAGQMATVALATALVLPNDPRVRTTVGSKKVILQNISRAKFEHLLRPVGERLLDPAQAEALFFDNVFSHILLHEVSHALGPQEVLRPDGSRIPRQQALRELYSVIEECKADALGLHNLLFLAEEGFFPREWRESAPGAFLSAVFRVIRFGTGSAHARANLLAFNFLRDEGAVRRDPDSGHFRAEPRRIARSIADLAAILLRLEGDGDYEGAQALVRRYVRVPYELGEALERVRDVPVDLAPTYPWAEVGAGR
ncbi:MAG: dipeptidyl-peptidase 3 family protein [Chloroflexia bacterium]